MLESYRRIFAYPGAAMFSGSGLLARLPISMMTLGIVVLVSAQTGSYSLAGQLSAAYIVGNALASIPQGRLADRYGQTRLLAVDLVLFALATLALVESIRRDWANPWPFVAAVLAGVSIPQVGSMVRARWTHLLASARERHTAFAVEAVIDEIVFVSGPVLVTMLGTAWRPEAGLLMALLFGTVGTAALIAQPRTAPPVDPARNNRSTRSPLPWRFLIPLAIMATCLGNTFGALEVAAVAVAQQQHERAQAGILLGAFALGSLVSGVLTGMITWRIGLRGRLIGALTFIALMTILPPFVSSLSILTLLLLATGLGLAPALIVLIALVEATTPRARLTEALAFVHTGMAAGIAPGAWVAGVVTDRWGGSPSFWVCAAGIALALLVASLLLPRTFPESE